ncbi:MAG: CHC2 zinc finger domain-containing protein [Bacteroidota bacterium]
MEIKEIKERLKIGTVLKHYGLQPDRNNMLKCPFHADDTASMKIYANTNTFNCFGCGKNGDQIEICVLKEGSKHKGILKATELTGEVKPINNRPKESKSQPKQNQNHTETLTKFFIYFQNNLNHPVSIKPKEYLQSRNLNHELLEMGYNSGQFHHRGKLGEEDQQACINAGLLIPYNGSVPNANGTTYTAFAKECIMFPLKNRQNQIVSLYGRSIQTTPSGQSARKSKDKACLVPTGKHFYLKDRSGLYPGHPNPNTEKLILTEAIIDAATLLQIPEITAEYELLSCYGTNGLTEEHLEAIKELHRLQEIIFFFDGDKAGNEAVEKYHKELSQLIPGQTIKLTKVETPEGQDVNSLAQGHEMEIFTHLLENRLVLGRIKEKPLEPSQNNNLFLLTEKNENPQEPVKTQFIASPPPGQLPAVSQAELNTQNPDFITYHTPELSITILGGINLQQLDRLRLTLKISINGGSPLQSVRHSLDLYHSELLEKFITRAGEQLETGTTIIRHALARLTELVEQYRLGKIESLKEQKPKARQLSEQRYKAAINYLKSPKLMQRTNSDIGKTGLIGEENNRLLMYLVFTSRLREQPLHIISLGASGTGKTYLQEKVSELIPEQDKLEITILSENAFYYFDRKELKNKLVLIEDMDGAENVLYPLRELQSKKKISKTIPIKDSKGNLKTITLHVEGPISLAGTTTREKLYEDNANRSLLIYLDGSAEHKEQIMEYQRRLSAGKVNSRQEEELKEFFKDMQTVLKPIKVRNPYAQLLKLPQYVFKPLRTNAHYLAVIETITFYHQWQRQIKTCPDSGEKYIETTLEDIEWANRLLKEVLLAKSDELSGECRSFFERLKEWVKKQGKPSFYASQVREAFRMNPSNLKYYLVQLSRYGLVKTLGGNRYKNGYEYEITNYKDYEQLSQGIGNVLDDVLETIKNKTSGQRGQPVDNYASYPHN